MAEELTKDFVTKQEIPLPTSEPFITIIYNSPSIQNTLTVTADPFEQSYSEVLDYFTQLGEVEEIKIKFNHETNMWNGLMDIRFSNIELVNQLIKIPQKFVNGKKITVVRKAPKKVQDYSKEIEFMSKIGATSINTFVIANKVHSFIPKTANSIVSSKL